MNATPENFKPGERWLVLYSSDYVTYESVCMEWSLSGDFVKVKHPQVLASGGVFTQWRRARVGARSVIELLERLPDVESGNHKTGQASGVEAPCGKCDCCRWEIEQHRNEITKEEKARLGRIVEKHKDEIEPGRTFSVIPPEA